METRDKWNHIVKQYHLMCNRPEADIQKEWESYCSELFDYKKIFGEIETFRSIRIGASERVIPDIILKIGNRDIMDVELKQYSLAYRNEFEEQLKSYLKQLTLSAGMIVCQKIYLCWLEYKENKIYKISIPFAENNNDGIKLMELLSKDGFSEEKIERFIKNKLTQKTNIQNIQQSIDSDLIKDLLLDHFVNQHYTDDEILQALDAISIDVTYKNHPESGSAPVSNPPPPEDPPSGDFPKKPLCVIIKTSYDRVNKCKDFFHCSEADALYHATRHAWRVSYDKVMRYGYVLSVIDKVVKEVYRVVSWQQVTYKDVWDIDDEKAPGRFEFTGEIADNDVREKFINKQIPLEYRKFGNANPVLYMS